MKQKVAISGNHSYANVGNLVAIVGMSCRFPGADSVATFWDNLLAGHDALTDIPASRAGMLGSYSPQPGTPGRSSNKQGGFVSDIDHFDHWLFGISRREAISMDPQQRILLELAWAALEDAGIPNAEVRGSRTGVYVGVCYNDYNDIQIQRALSFDVYRMSGGFRSMLCGRISHALGLAGPSLSIDAACASSLVAVHLAVQSLRSGESELALVAGVNLLLHPMISVGFSQARMLSPTSRCRAFSRDADGFVRSDGAGLVVLKPLSRALADGDRIYAVLRGSAVNNDGVGDGPLMTPSAIGQELVLRAAYADAGVEPRAVSYVEAHGTGTLAGDPIEAQALGRVLAPGRHASCRLGSVKSNIGHTEAAAGIAALIKTALCLHHQTFVPSLHCATPNPDIPWQEIGLSLQQVAEPWIAPQGPRIAGVSAFGLNGTNAHAVLSEAPPQEERKTAVASEGRPAQLLTISAHSPAALQQLIAASHRQLAQHVGTAEPAHSHRSASADLADYCAAAAQRRSHLQHRAALVCSDWESAVRQLALLSRGESEPLATCSQVAHEKLPLVFLYSGQGSQWSGMARRLFAVSGSFRSALQRCDDALARFGSQSIVGRLCAEPPTDLLGIDSIQPALFAIQVALSALLAELGIVPDLVIGHSMGEVAAAHVAGALDLSDAARIICQRSRLLRRRSGQGAMAVLELPLAETQQLLQTAGFSDRVSVAVSSSRRSTVIAGEPQAVQDIVDSLLAREVFARLVQVDVASHSPQMDELREPLLQQLRDLQPRQLVTPMMSTVTAQSLSGRELTAEYWVRNLRQPVLLAQVIETVLQRGEASFVEISPHPLLLSAVQQSQAEYGRVQPALATLRKQGDDWESILSTVGALHCRGHHVDFSRLFPWRAPVVALPRYPFSAESCLDEQAPRTLLTTETFTGGVSDPCLGTELPLAAVAGLRAWQMDARHALLPSFNDHRVFGEVVVPGAATIAWALTAAQRAGLGACAVEDARFSQVLFLAPAGNTKLQLHLSAQGSATWRLRLLSASAEVGAAGEWQQHAEALLRPARLPRTAQCLDMAALRASPRRRLDHRTIYELLAKLGLGYGSSFQWLDWAELGAGDALASPVAPVAIATQENQDWAHGLQPTVLDGCLQLLVLANLGASSSTPHNVQSGGFVPVRVEAVRVRGDVTQGSLIYAQTRDDTGPEDPATPADRVFGDVFLLSATGQVLLEIVGVTAQPLEPKGSVTNLWQLRWQPSTSRLGEAPNQRSAGYDLLLGSAGGAAEQLQVELQRRGRRCVRVVPGPRFSRLGTDVFELMPGSDMDWQQLEALLSHDDRGPLAAVVYLMGLDDGTGDGAPTPEQLPTALEWGSIGLMSWLQAHTEHDPPALKDGLLVVTRGARGIDVGTAPRPLQALLWGFAGVLGNECPELRMRRIDLDESASPSAIASMLQHELSESSEEQTVAWRAGQRHVARLVPDPLRVPGRRGVEKIRSDATYLVTGGLSGLGLLCARWLAKKGATRIVLIGRRSATAESSEQLDQLRQQGVEIVVSQTDIRDAEALRLAFAEIENPARPLRGIVHSAAVLSDGAALTLRREQLREVVDPKVLGVMNLEQMTRSADLDFFVLFSSVAAVLGNPGQSAYCAANSFLDSFAERYSASGRNVVSMAWGPWAETGLAARGSLNDALAQRGLTSLTPDVGMALFATLLLGGSATCCPIAAEIDPMRWQEQTKSGASLLAAAVEPSRAAGSAQAAPPRPGSAAPRAQQPERLRDAILAQPSDGRPVYLLHALRDMVAKILRIAPSQSSQLAPELPFSRMGLDSLMAIELRNSIDAVLGVRVPLSVVMQGGTLARIAAHILQELKTESAVEQEADPLVEGAL